MFRSKKDSMIPFLINQSLEPSLKKNTKLVGGFGPSEKYARQNGCIFPNFRVENKEIIELPPPRKLLANPAVFSPAVGSKRRLWSRRRGLAHENTQTCSLEEIRRPSVEVGSFLPLSKSIST